MSLIGHPAELTDSINFDMIKLTNSLILLKVDRKESRLSGEEGGREGFGVIESSVDPRSIPDRSTAATAVKLEETSLKVSQNIQVNNDNDYSHVSLKFQSF